MNIYVQLDSCLLQSNLWSAEMYEVCLYNFIFEHISIENDLEEKVWMRSEEIKDQFKHDHQDWTHNHIYTHIYGAFITVFLLEDEDNDIIKSTVPYVCYIRSMTCTIPANEIYSIFCFWFKTSSF